MAEEYAPNRIREWRLERGLTLEQLAHAVSPETALSTIAKLEKRKMGLTLDWMNKLAKILKVTAFDLIDTENSFSEVRMVVVRGTIAAGTWHEAVAEADGAIPCRIDVGGANCFALRVQGDSMDLLVRDGGAIVVDPDDRELRDGKYYAVANVEGEATFKRFKMSPPTLEPVSSNDEHQPIALGSEPFTVVGRVVWAGFQP